MRQVPGWASLERWIPMTVTLRLAGVPRAALLLMLLALCLALTAGTIAVGSRLDLFATAVLPAPVGPAANGLIAYDSGGDIWVAGPDGTGTRPLTSGSEWDWGPTWSRDGTRLVHYSKASRSGTQVRLVIVNADGSSPVTVATHDQADDPEGIDWSPDGMRLAYTLHDAPMERVVVAATDGSGFGPIGDPAFRAWSPDWSPDGSLIAFGGGVGTDQAVYLMSPDGSDVRRLSRITDAMDSAFVVVDWSPDGTRLVSQAGHLLWVFAADGSGESEVAGTTPDSILPRWSPDGTRIAFNDAPDSLGRYLSVIPAGGGEPTRLASDLQNRWSWSPDGELILGVSPTGLVAIDPTTGDVLWQLPQGTEGVVEGASWQRIAS
jgi:Tol biopolymer transport system component